MYGQKQEYGCIIQCTESAFFINVANTFNVLSVINAKYYVSVLINLLLRLSCVDTYFSDVIISEIISFSRMRLPFTYPSKKLRIITNRNYFCLNYAPDFFRQYGSTPTWQHYIETSFMIKGFATILHIWFFRSALLNISLALFHYQKQINRQIIRNFE